MSVSSDNFVDALSDSGILSKIYHFVIYHPFYFLLLLIPIGVMAVLFCQFICMLGCAILYAGLLVIYYYTRFKRLFCDGSMRRDDQDIQTMVARWFNFVGNLWHDYEIIGMENIPDEPTMFVLYHGPIPVDGYYLFAKLIEEKDRVVCAILNKNHFKMPCCTGALRSIRAGPWTKKQCVEILQAGSDICLLPGGKYESRMSDNKYQLEWADRIGFAKVALEAKVAIVPVFTKNIQEAFWTPWYAKAFTKGRFSRKKQFFNLIAGGLPVKLTTFIGKPLRCEEGTTPEELAKITREALQEMINANQIVPGDIWRALNERFGNCDDGQTPPVKQKIFEV